LGDNSVTSNKLGDNAVTSNKLDDHAVTSNKLGANAVNSTNFDTSDNYNFTGSLQKDGENLTGGDLYVCTVDYVLDVNTPDIDDGSAPNTVDGSTITGDHTLVLAFNQSQAYNNKIHITSTVGTGSNGTWTVPTSRDEDGELPQGLRVIVRGGTKYGGSVIVLKSGLLSQNNLQWELDDSLHPDNSGETVSLAGADGSKTAFDLSSSKVAYIAGVVVGGTPQPPNTFHLSKGTGTDGKDQLAFESGCTPPNGASIELIVLLRK
jgi:hypothetical protein